MGENWVCTSIGKELFEIGPRRDRDWRFETLLLVPSSFVIYLFALLGKLPFGISQFYSLGETHGRCREDRGLENFENRLWN